MPSRIHIILNYYYFIFNINIFPQCLTSKEDAIKVPFILTLSFIFLFWNVFHYHCLLSLTFKADKHFKSSSSDSGNRLEKFPVFFTEEKRILLPRDRILNGIMGLIYHSL